MAVKHDWQRFRESPIVNRSRKHLVLLLSLLATATVAACGSQPVTSAASAVPPPLLLGECFMRPVEVTFPLLSVTPTEYSLRTLDTMIEGASPCGHDDIRNYVVVLSVETMIAESTDVSVQKHIDAERVRYVKQYIEQSRHQTGWVRDIYTESRTDYEWVYKERLRAPNYNYVEVWPTY
jgi:hypothetical protein